MVVSVREVGPVPDVGKIKLGCSAGRAESRVVCGRSNGSLFDRNLRAVPALPELQLDTRTALKYQDSEDIIDAYSCADSYPRSRLLFFSETCVTVPNHSKKQKMTRPFCS